MPDCTQAHEEEKLDPLSATRKLLADLDDKRKTIETEADAIVSELTAEPDDAFEKPMGIDTPLVDLDGYPRNDIDVVRAKQLRGRLALLRTDHKEIMRRVEENLVHLNELTKPTLKEQDEEELQARLAPKPKPKFDKVTGKWVVRNWDGTVSGVPGGDKRSFDNLSEAPLPVAAHASGDSAVAMDTTDDVPEGPPLVAFAKIDAVAGGSPASQAGLQEGDLVLKFGRIDHTNHHNLLAVGALVPEAAGNKEVIVVWVLRKNSETNQESRKELKLVPRPWDGRGLVGCHILPYSPAT